jgi:outer membrane murein-binding lipoprotein Lpp
MDFWTLVPPAIISMVLSPIIAAKVAKWASRKSDWSARVDEVTRDLRALSEQVREYWSKPLGPEELVPISVSIRALYLDITEQLSALRERQDVVGFDSPKMQALHEEIFDIATGADFESPNRLVDPQRALEAAAKVDELRNEVNRCRAKLL